MTECFMLDCDNKAVHTITDAVENPKEFNGKKICKEHQTYRELLKAEPKEDTKKEEESK